MMAAELIALLELLPQDARVVIVYDDGTAEGEIFTAEADAKELRLLVE